MVESQKPVVAVITGASSGIGKETAKALAGKGWKVIGIGRNPARCEEAKAEILTCAADPESVVMLHADLAVMSETLRAAEAIGELTGRVDLLLNNAGGLTSERTITPEGNENTFASNHLGHFLLTLKLLPLIRESLASMPAGTTRIINVSSSAHEHCEGLDWNDLQMKDNFISSVAYCRVKLANILFTRELVRRYGAQGLIAHAMHPGVVNTNFASHGDDAMQEYMRSVEDSAKTAKEAADTLIWLATAVEPGTSNGLYFYEREAIPTTAAAEDDEAAQRLWEESEKLVAEYL